MNMMSGTMTGGCFRVVWVVGTLFATVSANAQPVNLIEERLDGVRSSFFELGPFYATPVIRLVSGYDSNALSTPDAQADINAMFGPGIRLGLPMGSSAFVDLYQEVDFVYYREQVDLRQVFNITRVGGGWGGRRLLFQIHDEFRDETKRPTSEFDSPVETRTNQLVASMTMALGWRQKLRARYQQHRNEIREGSVDDPTIPMRLNNTRNSVSLDFGRHVTSKTEAIVEAFFEDLQFDDFTRDSTSYGARFGLDFSPDVAGALVPSSDESGISGRLFVGFRKLDPVDADRVDYTGLIGTADVSVTSSRRHRFHGVFERDIVPSILDENWYFVENRVGAFFRWQLHERFSIEPGAILGKNNYPLPGVFESEDGEILEEEIVDEHTSLQLTLEYNIRKSWTIGVTTRYLERRSNVFDFDKDRLVVSFILNLRP